MNFGKALVISTAMVCGTALIYLLSPSQASKTPVETKFSGDYMAVSSGSPTVWIVDTKEGKVKKFCHIGSGTPKVIICTP